MTWADLSEKHWAFALRHDAMERYEAGDQHPLALTRQAARSPLPDPQFPLYLTFLFALYPTLCLSKSYSRPIKPSSKPFPE